MALGPRLDLRQSQSLVMTPQLQQAIKLLALSNLEIEAFIAEARALPGVVFGRLDAYVAGWQAAPMGVPPEMTEATIGQQIPGR